MGTTPTHTVEADLNGTGVLVDVTGYVDMAAGISHTVGRSDWTQAEPTPGSLQFTLDNVGGRFTPGFTTGIGGVYASGCRPGTRVKWTCGARVRLFWMGTPELVFNRGVPGGSSVVVNCVDDLSRLAQHKLRSMLHEHTMTGHPFAYYPLTETGAAEERVKAVAEAIGGAVPGLVGMLGDLTGGSGGGSLADRMSHLEDCCAEVGGRLDALEGGATATATAGWPGTWSGEPAATFTAMSGFTAAPAEAWWPGQHVELVDETLAYWDGTIWKPCDLQIFTTDGAWTKPAFGDNAYLFLHAGGAGGEAGMVAEAATLPGPGGRPGGTGSGWSTDAIPLSELAASETVTVGAGGAGGPAITYPYTTGSMNGDWGMNPSRSFGAHGGDTTFGETGDYVAEGALAQTLTTSGGGAAGGGVSWNETTSAYEAGSGEDATTHQPALATSVPAGGGPGQDGEDGVPSVGGAYDDWGGDGAGGGASLTGNGGNGGNGAIYGGGGGGGGNAVNSHSGGAGGNGADGCCIVFVV